MYKHIGLFLLFVLSFFVTSSAIADSDCNSNKDPNYFRAEDLLVIGEDSSTHDYVKTDADYRKAYPNYFRAEDLLVMGEDSSTHDYVKTDADYRKAYPNYFRAEDLLVIGEDRSPLEQVKTDFDNPVDQSVLMSKNPLPQLDDNLAEGESLLAMSEVETSSPPADILRQSANEFFGEAKFELAIEQYKALLAFEPNNVSAHFSIGYAYYGLKNPAQAVIYHQQALVLQPDHLYAQYLLAMSYSMLDMPEEARELMSVIYVAEQYDGAYPIALGHVFRNLGYMEAAGAEFYTWLLEHETIRLSLDAQLDGTPTALVMDTGVVYELPFLAIAGDAVQISVESYFLNPSPIDPLIVVLNPSGIALAGDDDSGELFDAMLTFTPSKTGVYTLLVSHAGGKTQGDLTLKMTAPIWTPAMYRSLAYEAIQQGLYQDGIDLLGYAIDLDGGRYHDYMSRAYAYRQLDDSINALTEFYLALETSPYPEEVYANIGQTYRLMGDMELASIAYSQALAINPLLHAVRCELGMIYASQGEYMSAVLQFDIILGYNISDSCAWSNRDATLQIMRELETLTLVPELDLVSLGRQYKASGHLFSAATIFIEVLKSSPMLDVVRCELGIIYMEWGNYLSAVEEFDRVLSHDSTNPCAQTQRAIALHKSYAPIMLMTAQDYVYKGNLYAKQENWELAAEAYATALKIDPILSDVRCQLGMIYVTLEDYPNAIEQFDILLTQNVSDLCAFENRRVTLRIMTENPATNYSKDYIEAMQAYSDVLLARDVYDYPMPKPSTLSYDADSIKAMQAYSDTFLVRDVYDYPVASEWASFSLETEAQALYNMSLMLGSDALMSEAQARHDAGDVWLASALLDRYIDEHYATTCSRELSVLADDYRGLAYTVMANMLELKAIGDSTC